MVRLERRDNGSEFIDDAQQDDIFYAAFVLESRGYSQSKNYQYFDIANCGGLWQQ